MSYTVTLEIAVYICIDGSRNSQSFLLWCAVCSSYAFIRLKRSLLRWRRTAVIWLFVCLYFMNIGQLQLSSDKHKGCIYKAPVRYVTKTWSVVLLNKKVHILLSQVYCLWQVVKSPTIILNNSVCPETRIRNCHYMLCKSPEDRSFFNQTLIYYRLTGYELFV